MIIFYAYIAGFLMYGALNSLCNGNYIPAGLGFVAALSALTESISENNVNNIKQQIKVLENLNDYLTKGKNNER